MGEPVVSREIVHRFGPKTTVKQMRYREQGWITLYGGPGGGKLVNKRNEVRKLRRR